MTIPTGSANSAIPDLPPQIFNPARLAAVQSTGLLDTESEEAFDALTRLAAQLTGAGRAFVTVVDERRSFWKSCIGTPDLPLQHRQNLVHESPCHILVATDQPLISADARHDPRLRHVPAVTQLGIGAWAGFPVHDRDGHVIGGLCVVDDTARAWTQQHVQTLHTLTAAVSSEIKLRQALARTREQAEQLRAVGHTNAALARAVHDSLLPAALAPIEGLQTAALYLPAPDDDVATGFYDVFRARGARWAAVIGHAAADGVPAVQAATAAQHTIRAHGLDEISPSNVLRNLNRALLHQPARRATLSAAYATIKADVTEVSGLLCTAGHAAALLHHPDGSIDTLHRPVPALGLQADPTLPYTKFDLHPGDTLLLHTNDHTTPEAPDPTTAVDALLCTALNRSPRTDATSTIAHLHQILSEHRETLGSNAIAVIAIHRPT
ncbi:PP2C family protein-serine/threonine phosphatase [Actinoplanes xinjiangensis]|uniref:PP2C family protein-serine/threonine phosphatase n=1 Tax=Actinoplanes xinjiangensis TaxID=512350 RepID=UPI003443085F